MSLILVGVNHKTASVEVRELLSVPESEVPGFIGSLSSASVIRGAALLSTCNRVEVVVSSEHEDVLDPVVTEFTNRASLPREEIERHLYVLRHGDVIRHLFRVASGLDSMIVGEPQIGGQVRAAYLLAQKLGTLDPTLTQLYETTLHVAKRVRTETGIGENAVSIPFAGVELAKKIFGDLTGLQVLLLGAGEMGELTAQHLHENGARKVYVANRSYEKAMQVAEKFEGEAIPFDHFEEKMMECDIVVGSTGAPHYVVNPPQVEKALSSRKRRNLFFIDLSVPRNIDPEVANVDGAYLYNIDDLQEVADANREKRMQKAKVAEQIIDGEVHSFMKRLMTQDAVPTIVELQGRLEEIRLLELEKCLRKMGPVTAEQRAAVEALSRGIINKVLHYPILRLKESAAEEKPGERESVRETIRKIFGLR